MSNIKHIERIIMCFMVMVLSLTMLAGCGNKTDIANLDSRPDTVANNLYKEFVEIISADKDMMSVADKLTQSKEFNGMSMGAMGVEPGYLNGFNEEVNGFKKGVLFAPMIGTIPFVGYIFETDDVKGLVEELKSKAQLNWNICTVADELLIETYDNYVFFVMAPEKFD